MPNRYFQADPEYIAHCISALGVKRSKISLSAFLCESREPKRIPNGTSHHKNCLWVGPAGEACRRVGRIGVWGSKTAFRHGYNDQEVSTEFMMLCKRRHVDTPIRPYISPSRPIFNATLRAAASWLFFCVLARPV
jgi:hypothetical protein